VKLGIIFTNDWELFGDGSGDYFQIQHRPLQALVGAMENHGAILTIMAEVGQQWAHQDLGETNQQAAEIAQAWEEIVRASLRRNMDVQLHFHPQWLGATHNRTKWQLDLTKWALSIFPRDEIQRVVCRGKLYLDSLLRSVDPTYECIAFRAGAYCMEPSHEIIPALIRAGIRCDTSVIKGISVPGLYNYANAYSHFKPWLTGSDNINCSDPISGALLEIPLYSVPMLNSPLLSKLWGIHFGATVSPEERKWFRDGRALGQARYPLGSRPFRRLSLSAFSTLLIRRSAVELDYDSLPADLFVQMISRLFAEQEIVASQNDDIIFPVLASGHVKQMHNTDNINRILEAVNKRLGARVTYWSLKNAAEYWLERLKSATPDSRRS
jgi:hypothetical protein